MTSEAPFWTSTNDLNKGVSKLAAHGAVQQKVSSKVDPLGKVEND